MFNYLVGATLIYFTVKQMQPRGIRNNNPGNIKNNGIKWEGLSAVQTDSVFYQFVSAKYGIRAMARILTNYQKNYGEAQDTIFELVTRWSATDQMAYVDYVSKAVGVPPHSIISYRDYLPEIIKAIIRFENAGINPYSDQTIREGIALA